MEKNKVPQRFEDLKFEEELPPIPKKTRKALEKWSRENRRVLEAGERYLQTHGKSFAGIRSLFLRLKSIFTSTA